MDKTLIRKMALAESGGTLYYHDYAPERLTEGAVKQFLADIIEAAFRQTTDIDNMYEYVVKFARNQNVTPPTYEEFLDLLPQFGYEYKDKGVRRVGEAQLIEQEAWDDAVNALSPIVGGFARDIHTAGKMGRDGLFVAFDYKGSEYSVNYDPRRQSYDIFKDLTSILLRADVATAKKAIRQLQGLGEARPWPPFASTYYYHRYGQRDLVGGGSAQTSARELVSKLRNEARGLNEADMRIARWESQRGKYWVDLYRDDRGRYYYRGDSGGGNLGNAVTSDEQAITQLQRQVDGGYFLPDVAKTPMRRVEAEDKVDKAAAKMAKKAGKKPGTPEFDKLKAKFKKHAGKVGKKKKKK